MEIRAHGGDALEVRAGEYSARVEVAGLRLVITWRGGTAALGCAVGEPAGQWSLENGAEPDFCATLSAIDGRLVHLEFRESHLEVWGELADPGSSPALLTSGRTPRFRRLFSPEPTALRRRFFAPGERAVVAIGSDPEFHGGHWFFSPPPFCFALESDCGHLAVGVSGRVDELELSAFEYDGAFRLRYDHPLRGPYRSPHLVLIPTTGDPYEAIDAYCQHLRDAGLAPRGTGRAPAGWWSEPNFCGWGEQSYRGFDPRTHVPCVLPEGAPTRSTQDLFEESMARLNAEGLDPGVVTIDDKWQECYGLAHPSLERWPDMAGFIASQHARGRRVLLWWKLWDGEGLPEEELLAGGERPVVDPTSPAYRARLAREVRHALLELGADGFKVDFLHRGPTPSHGAAGGGASGVRLLRSMLEALRTPALEAKPDCLVATHAANPYLADLSDVIRLNDISCLPGSESFLDEMRHRARLARLACPEALIDTDNWPCPDRRQWAEYVAAQPEIGIPSLYYATGIDLSGEPLLADDYGAVRAAWERWRERGGTRGNSGELRELGGTRRNWGGLWGP